MQGSELPITGYLDRLSGRPGEPIQVKVSVRDSSAYEAKLERLICGDPNPAGPGLRFEDLSTVFRSTVRGRQQAVTLGSTARAPGPELEPAPHTWTAIVFPTRVCQDEQIVLTHIGERGGQIGLSFNSDGVCARLSGERGTWEARTQSPPLAQRWQRIWAALDSERGELSVGFTAPPSLYEPAHADREKISILACPPPSGGRIWLAGSAAEEGRGQFTGKIEGPAILQGLPDFAEPFVTFEDLAGQLVAGWDFSIGIDTPYISPVGPRAQAGELFNLPMRGVTGVYWDGSEHCWRHAPKSYGAIKFHEDDLGDARWETDFTFEIPKGLHSGAYGLRLSCAAGEDWIPFYVLPERQGPKARVVFLAPTYTYQAYGNHARDNTDAAYKDRVKNWGAYPYNPDQYPLYGRSTYNRHLDTEGISLVSRLRPLLTMRPGFLTFVDPRGSGLRHFPADSHLLAWLESKAIDFDVVTDEDLEEEGVEILASYNLLLTGSHPEYHTSRTLDALQAFVRGGGNMAYLGANGFYWRIARDPARPWAIELRRAESGVRRWGSQTGEYYNSLDGQLGGLWRRNGRAPQQLVGVGFSSQGPYDAGYFRRTPESWDPQVQWLFDGVEGEAFGDYGLIAGGAAGFELDRLDHQLGSPRDAVVVARSDGLPPGFFPVPEDLCAVGTALEGGSSDPLVRADMTLFKTPQGGTVFSASAISFCGSLWKDGAFDGPVSRLLENVVRRLSRRNP